MKERRPSLSYFLTLLVSAVAVSGVAVYAASVFAYSRSMAAASRAETSGDAALIAEAVKAVLGESVGRIDSIAAIASLPMREGGRSTTNIAEILDRSPILQSVRVLDAAGRVGMTVPPEPSLLGTDLSQMPLVASSRESSAPRWSSIYAGLREGEREISVAMQAGEGTILIELDLEGIVGRIRSLLSGTGDGLAITDAGGTYIAHSDDARVARREADSELIRQRLKSPGLPVYRYERELNGIKYLVHAELIPETGWYCLVERPADFAAKAVLDSIWAVSAIAASIIGISSAFAGFASRRLILDVAAAAGLSGSETVERPMFFRETAAIRDKIMTGSADNRRLAELNERLSQTLSQLSKTQAALVVSEKLALLGRLAATVAHDLNTPIGASLASASVIESAVLDCLTDASTNPRLHGATGARAFRAIVEAVSEFGTQDAAAGSERRRAVKRIEEALTCAGTEDADEIAGRLVDIGLRNEASIAAVAAAAAANEAGDACYSARASLDWALALAEVVVAARVITSAAKNSASVVSSLRSYVKGGDERGDETLDAAATVREAVALVRGKGGRSVDIGIEAEAEVFVSAKRDRLTRIWLNLLMNSIEAMENRGIIKIRVRGEGGMAIFEFEDNGPGIPEPIREMVWQPFFTTKSADQGTGLGLPIVKETIEEMGGSVRLESRPGRTVFAIRLPAASAEVGDA